MTSDSAFVLVSSSKLLSTPPTSIKIAFLETSWLYTPLPLDLFLPITPRLNPGYFFQDLHEALLPFLSFVQSFDSLSLKQTQLLHTIYC